MDETPMNNTPQQQTGNGKKEGHVGPLIGTAIIILVLVAGAVYYWGSYLKEERAKDQPTEESSGSIADLQTQSSSDEVSDIESDLDNTNLDSLDAELSDIESELGI